MTVLTPSSHGARPSPVTSTRLDSHGQSSRLRSATPGRSGTPTPRGERTGSTLVPSHESVGAILQDGKVRDVKLDADRRDSSQRLLDAWTAIAAKYGAIDPDEDDEVDIMTGRIICDRGKLREMKKLKLGRALWDSESEDEEENEFEDVEEESWGEAEEGASVDLDQPVIELDAGDDILDAWGEDSRHELQIDYNVPDYLLAHLDLPKLVLAWTKEDDEDLKAFLRIEEEKRLQRGELLTIEDELELKGLPDLSSPIKDSVKEERARTPLPQEPLLTSRLHGTVHLPASSIGSSSPPTEQEDADPLSDPTAGTSSLTPIDLRKLRLSSSAPRPFRQSFAHLFQPLPPTSSSKIKQGSPASSYSPKISSPLAQGHALPRLKTPSSPLNPQSTYRRHAPAPPSQLAGSGRVKELSISSGQAKREPSPESATESEARDRNTAGQTRGLIGVVIAPRTPSVAVKRESDISLPPQDSRETDWWTDIDILKEKARARAAAGMTTLARDYSALGGGWGEVSRVSGRQRKHISETKEYKTFFLMPLKKRRERRTSGDGGASLEAPTSPTAALDPATPSAPKHIARRQRIRAASQQDEGLHFETHSVENQTIAPPPRRHTLSGHAPNGLGPRPHTDADTSIVSMPDVLSSGKRGRGRPRKRCGHCMQAGRLDRAEHCFGRRLNGQCDFIKAEELVQVEAGIEAMPPPVDHAAGPTPAVKTEQRLGVEPGCTKRPARRAEVVSSKNRRLGEPGPQPTTSCAMSSRQDIFQGPPVSPNVPDDRAGEVNPASRRKRKYVRRVKSEDCNPAVGDSALENPHQLEAAPLPEDLPLDTIAAMTALAAADEIPLDEEGPTDDGDGPDSSLAEEGDEDILLLGGGWFDSSPASKPTSTSARPRETIWPSSGKRKGIESPGFPLKRVKHEGSTATPPKGWNPSIRYLSGTEIIDLEEHVPLGEVSDDELDSW